MERAGTLIMEQPAAAPGSPVNADTVWGRLVPAQGASVQGEIELRGESVSLGRAVDLPAACTFKDRRISSHHCRIARDADLRVWIEDLSANGTFVNGTRVGKGHKKQMQIGDLVVLASTARQAKKDENFYGYIFEMPAKRVASDATEPDADSTLVDSPAVASPVRTKSLTRQKSKDGSQNIGANDAPAPLLRKGSSMAERKRKAEDDQQKQEKEARKDEKQENNAAPAAPPPAAAAVNNKEKREEEDHAKAALEGMEADLTCTICQEIFYRCVGVLPCLHNFCAPCYGAWRKRGKQCPICRQRVKGVQINHSMRNMVTAFLKQYPERNRDPASLLDLDAAGDLTEEMLKEGKTKASRDNNDDEDREDEENEDEDDEDDDGSGSDPGVVSYPVGPLAPLRPFQFGYGGWAGNAFMAPFSLASAPAAMAMRCRQCNAAGPDGFRCNLDGTARHFYCKACYQPFPDRSSNPPPNAAPVRCEFCNGYFCNAYWNCTAAMGKKLAKLSEIGIPDDVPDTSFGGNREEKQVLKTVLQATGKTADQAFKAALAAIDAGTFNAAHNGRAVLGKSVSCENCATQIWGLLAYEYRTRLVKKEELPADVAARPDCHWGKNCRTVLHNLAHAKRFNHICEQTKFS